MGIAEKLKLFTITSDGLTCCESYIEEIDSSKYVRCIIDHDIYSINVDYIKPEKLEEFAHDFADNLVKLRDTIKRKCDNQNIDNLLRRKLKIR